MSDHNSKLIQVQNDSVVPTAENIESMRNKLIESVHADSTIYDRMVSDITSVEIIDGTNSFIQRIVICGLDQRADTNLFLGNNINPNDIVMSNSHFKISLPEHLQNEHKTRYFGPNKNSAMSIETMSQNLDLTFLLDRFEVYKKLDAIDFLYVTSYDTSFIAAVVIRKGFTFLSNLKLMSKDTWFDQTFKDNPEFQDTHLLDTIRLTSDTTTYDGTNFDLDELNLVKLNISVVNSLDWYVAYNVTDNISEEEIEYIINKCKLEFKFVNRYNSEDHFIIKKKLLIGQ